MTRTKPLFQDTRDPRELPPQTETRTLPVKLSPEERDDRARSLARVVADQARIAAEAKRLAKDYKRFLDDLAQQSAKLSDAANTGVEEREVTCEVRLVGGLALITRTDTGELLESRPATRRELARLQTTIEDFGG